MHSFLRIVVCAYLISPPGHAFTLVHQTPRSVTAQPGESVDLTCSFNGTGQETTQVRWFRYATNKTSLQINICYRHNVTSQFINRAAVTENNSTSILSLDALLPEDTGVYVCEVERWIPEPFIKKQGNGTLVNIAALFSRNKHPADIIYYIASVLILALVLGIVAVVRFKRTVNSSVSRVPGIQGLGTPECIPEQDSLCSRPDTQEVCYASLNFNNRPRTTDPIRTGLMPAQYEATENNLPAKGKADPFRRRRSE
ncbi:uncharacterized protein LOC121300339 isoform X2 [Polyodon spathula]|uniref:uncharacterized protein LOC121300339 isoform X2 n=1 Tax=Polyodon spathula TaxID=7913 RepID=UPI001B7DE963|nr:uncharacterized protein LOC121300339 isoform X2 [Polyodon spathula]